ncbi:MAG: hypothetical protein Q9187_004347 [Circinaria calcarea]
MASKFVYQPLNGEDHDMRLMYTMDNASASQLHCTIVNASLDKPPYSALSYTWQRPVPNRREDAVSTSTVYLDEKPLEIGTKLEGALRYLRTYQLGLLWIDAICIEQSNLDERGEQVARMRKIYLKAQMVLGWLGAAADTGGMAMDLLVLLAQRAENHGTVAWLESHALDPMNFEAWKALQDLLSRNWWKRSWAIQEFALGHEVHLVCGERRLTCSQLERANRVLFDGWSKIFDKGTMLKIHLNARAQDMMRNLLTLRRYLQSGKTVSLLMCLSDSRLVGVGLSRSVVRQTWYGWA